MQWSDEPVTIRSWVIQFTALIASLCRFEEATKSIDF